MVVPTTGHGRRDTRRLADSVAFVYARPLSKCRAEWLLQLFFYFINLALIVCRLLLPSTLSGLPNSGESTVQMESESTMMKRLTLLTTRQFQHDECYLIIRAKYYADKILVKRKRILSASALPRPTTPTNRLQTGGEWAQAIELQECGNFDLASGLAVACQRIARQFIGKRAKYRTGDMKRLHWTDILGESFNIFRRAESKNRPQTVERCARLAYIAIIRQYQLSSERKRIPTESYRLFIANRAKYIRNAIANGVSADDARTIWKRDNTFTGIRFVKLSSSQFDELVASDRNAPVSLDSIDSKLICCVNKYIETIDNQDDAREFISLVREHMGYKFGTILLSGFSIRRACTELSSDSADDGGKPVHWQTIYRRWESAFPRLAKRFA